MKLELTLGEILQSVSFMVVGIATYTKMSDRITKIEAKLDMMYETWKNYMIRVERSQ